MQTPASHRHVDRLPDWFIHPSPAFSLTPFWFWNDRLEADEIIRQIEQMLDRGIHGFVLHPRVGLPADCAWMSPALLEMMAMAITYAAKRGMHVILYDEGMYPSGSASGLVVAENPDYSCRGLVCVNGALEDAPEGQHIVAQCRRPDGQVVTIVDRAINSWIRGLHLVDHDAARSSEPWQKLPTPELRPPATDLLNPEAVTCFIRHSYQRYFDAFGQHFGKTITAIFTDEPMVLGRGNPYDARPGTTGILEHVNAWLGYDFAPHLLSLWQGDNAESKQHRRDYKRAIAHRLGQTYYQPLYDWCEDHGVALTGHPAEPDDLNAMRYFHWPGQDVIFNHVEPGEPSVSGSESTQAKAAASVAVHHGRARNANEFMGAYGHDVPLSLYQFVAGWLLVRGCNLLIPHACFYSTRGPRMDDCPPQLGPHAPWWNDPSLPDFHTACQRLCQLNATGKPVVHVAIVCGSTDLPIAIARQLYEAQIDFHYLDQQHLQTGQAGIETDGIHIADMHYHAAIVMQDATEPKVLQSLAKLEPRRSILAPTDQPIVGLVETLRDISPEVVRVEPATPWLRCRCLDEGPRRWMMTFNEGTSPIDTAMHIDGANQIMQVDPTNAQAMGHGEGDTIQLQLDAGAWSTWLMKR